jgi:hypothetical protein
MASEPPSHMQEFYDHIKGSPWDSLNQAPNVADSRGTLHPPLRWSYETPKFMQNYPKIQATFFDFVGTCHLCLQLYDRIDTRKHFHVIQCEGILEVEGFSGKSSQRWKNTWVPDS